MSSFERSINTILHHEGGYVNNPNDPGGETKYGISKRTYPSENIKDLTIERAKEIYRRDWWDKYQYEKLPQKLATKVFDLSVNMGAKQAHKLLQRAIRAAGIYCKDDGILGPKSHKAIRALNENALLTGTRIAAAYHYKLLIAKNPRLNAFAKGWEIRAYS